MNCGCVVSGCGDDGDTPMCIVENDECGGVGDTSVPSLCLSLCLCRSLVVVVCLDL